MFDVYINYIAVFVSAVIPMILGSLWYGPLFGKLWMKMVGVTEKMEEEMKKKNMIPTFSLMFLGCLVMSWVLAFVSDHMLVSSLSEGMMTGGVMWVGFVSTTMLSSFLFSVKPKPWMLYVLDSGYYLVSLMCMGGVIGYLG